MSTLPKLLPSWHDLSLQDFVRKKEMRVRVPFNSPDFGGIGVDINLDAKRRCTIPKFFKSHTRFASQKCALPFLPLKSLDCLTDPCLESLEKERHEFNQFSVTLASLRNFTTIKAYRARLVSLKQKLSHIESENKGKEINVAAPKSILQLADTIPKRVVVPDFNAAYIGGNLASCKLSDKWIFIHPSSRDLNKLCITPLLEGSDQHFVPNIPEQITIILKKEPILQINQALDGFCVRQKNSYHLVNAANMNTCSKTVYKSALYQIAANPYNPTEILSIYEKGVMKLKNMVTKKTVWSMLDDVYDDPYNLYPTWRCTFGSHPFSAMCLNESKFYSFDIREQMNSARVIFNADNPSFYIAEELVSLKQWNKNPFQHFLTSSHHLILCDERYPKTPVMLWNHCLKNLPVYIDCVDLDSDISIIVIATQKSPQVSSFLCSHQRDIQPVSLNSPLLLSSPSDCIKSLKFHSYYIDDKISKRFSSPLTGICVIPHHSEIGFSILQSTSLGDIFYQDFKQSSEATERTYHVSTGCILTPPEKILPHLNQLISKSDCDKVFNNTNEVLSQININIDKVLSPPKDISSNCMLCRLISSADNKELTLSEICPTCNLNSAESQHFTKAVTNESLLIGPIHEDSGYLDCDINYLSKFDDKYSKRILSVWLESENVGESPSTDVQNTSDSILT